MGTQTNVFMVFMHSWKQAKNHDHYPQLSMLWGAWGDKTPLGKMTNEILRKKKGNL